MEQHQWQVGLVATAPKFCFLGPWVSTAGALPGQPGWFPSLESMQRLMPAKKQLLWVGNLQSLVLLQALPEVVLWPTGSRSDECSQPCAAAFSGKIAVFMAVSALGCFWGFSYFLAVQIKRMTMKVEFKAAGK